MLDVPITQQEIVEVRLPKLPGQPVIQIVSGQRFGLNRM
jgi:hypothetical protein